MHVFATRRLARRHAVLAVLMALIASAALAGCQHPTPVSAEIGPGPSTELDGVFDVPFSAPEHAPRALQAYTIWDAPAVAQYPFERIEPAISPEPTAAPVDEAPVVEASPTVEEPASPPDTGRLVDAGIASTYGEGDGFQGRRTACGQRFDTNVPQVAHKSLPCGTVVRVEDTTTGKSVVAEVTDRGPYVRGRVVDLSLASFRQLHPGSPDLLGVRVYVVDPNAA